MANPFYDAVQSLEQAQKLIGEVIKDLKRAMDTYEDAATKPEGGKPPPTQLPA